ncbi:MAG: tetratricopeptide repeat protein [Bacteroidaceae bacterium]|nr:tetratricopeptide repeat protein [Bacteroidaceae bacterium]
MKRILYIVYVVMSLAILGACSTDKNTPMTRRVQAFKARYNTYFNGNEAYKEGRLQQEEGNKDNFTEIIPLYLTGNKATVKIGANNFDVAVEKSQKTIKTHSITKRPDWKKSRPKTAKDKIWLSQKEYNPFLWRAWFLMGEAQFRKGEYMEAASTFAYIQRLYFSKPNLVARARLLEARCYAEMEWFYDAEDLITRAQRDSFPTSLEPLKASVLADIQLRQKQYPEAILNIEKALKGEHRSLPKARMYMLLGQLYHKIGHDPEAFRYFKKVIRKNPPYELEFNAQIQMTEAMAKGKSKQMIRKLTSMAKNPKNKEYLDQVYYAIGNIHLAKGDTTRAIWAYKDGVEKSTRNGLEKGVVMLHLGELYWDKEKFVDAQQCYSQVLGLLDKEHEKYKEADERGKILDELLPFASAVEVQDSLQMMASLDSVTLMAKIKKTIEELKKKEREEEKRAMEATNAQRNGTNQPGGATAQQGVANRNGQQPTAVWYFYNPTAVTAGKTEFEKKWGKRDLEDNWRRSNKTVLNDFNEEEEEEISDSLKVVQDSIAAVEDSIHQANKGKKLSKEEKDSIKAEEYANDPHRPEFYLKDIPFTEEQMAASNAALVEGLYGSAIIYKDRMDNFPLAERTFQRILIDFPEFDKMDDICYNMFQLYSRMQRSEDAEVYRQKLIEEYPDNEHSKLIADPNFEFKGRYGKQIEDSIYSLTYDAFQYSDYQTVINNSQEMEREYPNGANRPRFMFLEAMSKLELGDREHFMEDLKAMVEKYPQSSVSELAGLYVKGLKEGRLLQGGKFEMGSIWQRRRGFDEADSLANDSTFSLEKNADFVFVIAYERDSIDTNQLLYEMARYNFTAFTVRNFDITEERGDGIDMMQVRTFLNYDEAYIYMHRLFNNADMAYKLQGLKCFIISEENLKKLMHGLSFADYFDFYDENFDRIGSLSIDEDEPSTLDEPTELPPPPEEDEEEGDWEEDDNFIF